MHCWSFAELTLFFFSRLWYIRRLLFKNLLKWSQNQIRWMPFLQQNVQMFFSFFLLSLVTTTFFKIAAQFFLFIISILTTYAVLKNISRFCKLTQKLTKKMFFENFKIKGSQTGALFQTNFFVRSFNPFLNDAFGLLFFSFKLLQNSVGLPSLQSVFIPSHSCSC